MQQNVRIKISCQNWAFNFYFAFWKLDLCHVLLLFLAYQTFQGSRKIELKTQLPLVSKKKTKKKRRILNAGFWRYEESALHKFNLYKFSTKCTDSTFDLVEI